MERTEENNATKDRFAHVGKTFSEMDSEKLKLKSQNAQRLLNAK